MTNNILTKITESKKFLEANGINKPDIGLILGSGLGGFADNVSDKIVIPYKQIPHFPVSTVEGHKGNLVLFELTDNTDYGKFNFQPSMRILAMQGRFHCYEGYSFDDVIYPIFVMKSLGVKILILTTASGGLNLNFSPGDIMVITDHINMLFRNSIYLSDDSFVSTLNPNSSKSHYKSYYCDELINIALKSAEKVGINLQKGVFGALIGPTYETASEADMLRKFGIDAVSMSTVPEATAAHTLGIKVLGLSCITNQVVSKKEKKVASHEEVIDVANRTKDKFEKLLREILTNIMQYIIAG